MMSVDDDDDEEDDDDDDYDDDDDDDDTSKLNDKLISFLILELRMSNNTCNNYI